LARYYFDVSDPMRVSDRIGMNLEDVVQIRHEALRRAAEFASTIDNLHEPGAIVIAVRDAAGEAVMTASLVCSVAVHQQSLDERAASGVETSR
jgi:hypothetical protein